MTRRSKTDRLRARAVRTQERVQQLASLIEKHRQSGLMLDRLMDAAMLERLYPAARGGKAAGVLIQNGVLTVFLKSNKRLSWRIDSLPDDMREHFNRRTSLWKSNLQM